MAPITTHSPSKPRVAFGKLLWVGLLSIGVAVLADLLVRTVAIAFFGVPEGFVYLQAPFLIGSIAFFGVLATLVFALVARFARRPVRLYRILASIALLASLLLPIMALSGQFPAPGMNLHIFWTMVVMHCVAALIMVSLLTRLALTSKREH
jgi:Family of unknown function (DUF6069)